ncbi:ATP/GTP-binding protein [Georgenia sp. EYE_87]|uniref:TRAFAC clade GTPase domain-containing protein n=1 Tax=Georgenia sp. EYE_87 TaxID=2853448 RepID=UPI0020039F0C|nr:ATP/GTP-binding protein [Georgenia sp. EYE_87]MCK6210529.1 ATP/GTP-binding protein [Georgenia sp. EYE_87]
MSAIIRVREQHIAVFGGSGSGKTVLVSSFYGAAQEQAFLKESLFHVISDDTGQGNRLRQNYLGMKNNARVPETTRFAATPYRFTLKMKNQGDDKTANGRLFDALRLVWHDYPGEWFEEEPSSEEEARRRVDTFRLLLRSDVALVLVDGQKLRDHAGEEEKYFKSLIWGLRDGLLRLKTELLDDGEPLVRFPRIWIMALSKADLHPEFDVHGFQDLVIEKAAGELASLQDVLTGMVQIPQALSIGEDFMLLSSAKFEPGRIEVTERVGLGLLLPVACLLPLERLARWAERFEIPVRWLDKLADNADVFAALIMRAKGIDEFLKKVPKVGPLLARIGRPTLAALLKLSETQIRNINAEARVTGDNLRATLTQFKLDLDQGVRDNLLVKSLK